MKKDFPDFWGKIKKKKRDPHAKEKQSNRLVHYNPDFNTNDWPIIFVFRFDNYFQTQKMAQEPYFENSDQSFKSNNTTLKNPTNIFWEKSTAKLAMPATHSKLLSLSSGKLVSYNAGEKNDEKMGNQSRNKKRNAKGNRKRVTWFLPISRKIYP